MKKYHCYSAELDFYTEKLFEKAEFLGQGNNGIVYKLPENKVVKIFVESKVCRDESYILSRTGKSKSFPKMYRHGKLYITRDMVNGIRLDKYIKEYGLDNKISENIFYVLKEFKKLKFTKIDSRCKDLYVCKKKKIMVIDPKKCFSKKVSYPRHLMKGLFKLNVLDEFLDNVSRLDEKKAIEWQEKFNKYCIEKIKEYDISIK